MANQNTALQQRVRNRVSVGKGGLNSIAVALAVKQLHG